MHSVPASQRHTTIMSKSCVQLVGDLFATHQRIRTLSTQAPATRRSPWIHTRVFPALLHKFCMRFYPPILGQITDGGPDFSPLSTALIIRTKWVNKENLLVGQGG